MPIAGQDGTVISWGTADGRWGSHNSCQASKEAGLTSRHVAKNPSSLRLCIAGLSWVFENDSRVFSQEVRSLTQAILWVLWAMARSCLALASYHG